MFSFIKRLIGLEFSNEDTKENKEKKGKDLRTPKTAQELMNILNKDPEYRRRKFIQEQEFQGHKRKVDQALKPVLSELNKFGIYSFENFLREYAPLNKAVITILLQWLPKVSGPFNAYMCLLIALSLPKERYHGEILAEFFDKEDCSDDLRYFTMSTIAKAKPIGLEDWLQKTIVRNDLTINAFMMVPLAVARLIEPQQALTLLYQVYDRSPFTVLQALSEIGGNKELLFLTQEAEKYKGEDRKLIKSYSKQLKERITPKTTKN